MQISNGICAKRLHAGELVEAGDLGGVAAGLADVAEEQSHLVRGGEGGAGVAVAAGGEAGGVGREGGDQDVGAVAAEDLGAGNAGDQ